MVDTSNIPQGRLVIGTYQGKKNVQKNITLPDNTPGKEDVPGMYELTISAQGFRGRTVTYRLTYTETDYDGEVTKYQERVVENGNEPEVGDLCAFRFASKGTLSKGRAFANDTVTDCIVLAKAPGKTPAAAKA